MAPVLRVWRRRGAELIGFALVLLVICAWTGIPTLMLRPLEQRFAVHHISPNSHLFVAAEPIADFPGRSFAIESIATMNKKELKQLLAGLTHANIAVRNFPLTVAQLRKKLKLKDGGSTYLFATTDAQGRHLVLRTKKRKSGSL